ncbi:hypothetical protein F5878DRAFT_647259 [Lentinula raphanica]|uniref:Uncharacterized protein n=1 Tax=Lentinula raphanica TaxID=153919 RepID=A0AA38NWF0_9AGAR|nr:hypothetical protein F5878DRAFT_647259 [Lentinula raphanica]
MADDDYSAQFSWNKSVKESGNRDNLKFYTRQIVEREVYARRGMTSLLSESLPTMSDAYWMYQHVIGSIGAAKPARAERNARKCEMYRNQRSMVTDLFRNSGTMRLAATKFDANESSTLSRNLCTNLLYTIWVNVGQYIIAVCTYKGPLYLGFRQTNGEHTESLPFKEIAAATVESNLSFGSSVDLKLSCLMGVILLTIGNATAVGAQDVHLEPHGNDQNGRPPPLPHETKHPAEDTGYRRRARPIPPLGEVVNIYISNLDYHTRLPTPQSVIALGNDPNDFARSGRLFRKRDPFNQLKKRRELDWRFAAISHNVDTLNVLLLYIRTKEVVSNFHFCAAVLNHFDEGGYLYEKTDWLEQFLHLLYTRPSAALNRRHVWSLGYTATSITSVSITSMSTSTITSTSGSTYTSGITSTTLYGT